MMAPTTPSSSLNSDHLESDPISLSAAIASSPSKDTEIRGRVGPIGKDRIGRKAKDLIQEEYICGIVLGLARLVEDEEAEGVDVEQKEGTELDVGAVDDGKALAEEDVNLDEWSSSSTTPTNWEDDEPLESFFDDEMDRSSVFDADETTPIDIPSVEPSFPIHQHRDNQDEESEESAIGKLVSMGLISAIGDSDCLDPAVVEKYLLPEVERMKGESMFYVRKAAVQALSSISKCLPIEAVSSIVVCCILPPVCYLALVA